MTGYYEIRLTGPSREQFRLFCLLENGTDDELLKRGLIKPAIAVIDGAIVTTSFRCRTSHLSSR